MAGTDLGNPRAQAASLPTELIIKIIAIVKGGHNSKRGQYGPSPIAASALVSRTWNTLCRPHMFHTVVVYVDTVLPRFSFLHFQAAHLCQYIRVLYFDATAAQHSVREAEWFPACFARLTNLRKLQLFLYRRSASCSVLGCVCRASASQVVHRRVEIRRCL